MKIQLLAFGYARELLGFKESIIQVPEAMKVSDLKLFLLEKYPELGSIVSFQLAVNEEYALADDVVNPDNTVAIIPPVSGG